MGKLVTIAMPIYNCSDYVGFAINSILKQTYPDWELIIVDDCSQDNTLDILSSYSDSRITIFRNSSNKGLAECLNQCIEKSSGEYLARMDGDDIMTVDRLEKQVHFLENNPEKDLIGSLAYLINQNNQILGYKRTVAPRNINDLIKFQSFFIHPTVMGKLDWFKNNQYDSDIKRGQDFELWLRTYQSSSFYVLNEYLLFYREVEINYKQKYYDLYINVKKILNKHKAKVSKHQYYLSLTKAYLKYLCFNLFKLFGFIQKKQQLDVRELKQIQQQLDCIII